VSKKKSTWQVIYDDGTIEEIEADECNTGTSGALMFEDRTNGDGFLQAVTIIAAGTWIRAELVPQEDVGKTQGKKSTDNQVVATA
jgi:hypothetical protein